MILAYHIIYCKGVQLSPALTKSQDLQKIRDLSKRLQRLQAKITQQVTSTKELIKVQKGNDIGQTSAAAFASNLRSVYTGWRLKKSTESESYSRVTVLHLTLANTATLRMAIALLKHRSWGSNSATTILKSHLYCSPLFKTSKLGTACRHPPRSDPRSGPQVDLQGRPHLLLARM